MMMKYIHVFVFLMFLFIACGSRVENPLSSESPAVIPSASNIIIDIGDGLLTSESSILSSSDTFTVALSIKPDYDIIIGTITSSDTSEITVSPSSLTFTAGNWDIPQVVTVTGVDDALADGIQSVSINLGKINCTECRGDPAGSLIAFNTDDEAVSSFPSVLFTVPVSGLTDIPFDSSLFVTFNKMMDPATITANYSSTVCTGSLQVSSDGFSSCVQMSSPPVSYNNDMTFEIVPLSLALSTTYQVRVTTGVQDSTGNNMQAEYTMTPGFTTAAIPDATNPTILIVDPYDTAAGIPVSDPVAVTFSESMDPATVTTNGAVTTCDDSLYAIQVSLTNTFTTSDICVAVFAAPEVTNNDYTYIVQPVSNLLTNTVYYLRISNNAGVSDASGNLLVDGLTTSFTTAISADSIRPSVSTISPDDNETSVPVNSDINILFSEQMEVLSVNVNITDSTCGPGSYAIEVSADNFASCVRFSGITPSIANKKYTVTTTSMPAGTYKIRINDSVAKDRAGNGVVYYIQPNGFTVIP